MQSKPHCENSLSCWHDDVRVRGAQLQLMPVQKKVPKKLGRPVTFKGDPESAALSEGERKRVKRRIANRESARRVRQKRQVLMEELHCKVDLVELHELEALPSTHCKQLSMKC